MTNTEKLNIIIKTQFNNVAVGVTPTTFYDESYIEYKITSYNTQCELSNNTKRIKISNSNSKLYLDTFFSTFKTVDFSTDIEFDITTLTADNTICSISTNSGATQSALNFRIFIRNTYEKGITIYANGWTISANYQFVINKKYVLSFTKKDDVYQLYIDGVSIGYKYSPTFTNNIITGSYYFIIGSSNMSSTSTSTSILNGNIYSFNYSIGPSLIHNQGFSRYGKNLISNLKFGNNGTDTSTTFYMGIETIYNAGVNWTLPTLVVNNGNLKLNGVPLSTNYTGKFTLDFNINSNTSQTSNIISYLGVYQLNMNIVGSGLPDPTVIVNTNTKSALDFENGIIDQIGTTVWNKQGTGNVTSVNKIFGDNSFETKALGDFLYTNSNIITGGATPFTIEFYALIKGGSDSSGYKSLLSKVYNGSYAGQGFSVTPRNRIQFQRQESSGTPLLAQDGRYNKYNNEIIKYTFTYDGSALRMFHNDKLDLVAGTSVGFYMGSDQPVTFMSLLLPSASVYNSTTFGLIDNINIFDGEARVVRDYDEHADKLIVDLAFDGENNSTKIIDNGILKSNWTVSGGAKISTDQKFDGFSSLYIPSSTNKRNIVSSETIFLPKTEDFTLSFKFKRLPSSDQFAVVLTTGIALYITDIDAAWSINAFTSSYPNQSYPNIRNKFSLLNEKNFTGYDSAIISNTTILDNVEYDVSFVKKDTFIYLYINGVLDVFSDVYKNNDIDFKNLCIGSELWTGAHNGFTGYIKNLKIYKDVAIIPESPVGKIQLDFDNNVIDKYKNSTWTNNGVTFDQVNSVKGYSAYFNSGNRLTTTTNNNLNFENKNYSLSFDTKLSSINTWNDFIYSGVPGSANGLFYSSAGLIRHRINGSLYYEFNINLLASQYYRFNQIRTNTAFVTYINDVVISTYNSSETMNLNLSNSTIIGSGANGAEYMTGYIDNFKSYKEDLSTINTTYIKNNQNFMASVVNNVLELKYPNVINSPVPYYTTLFDDSPSISNFICEIETLLKPSIQTRLCFRTNDFSYYEDEYLGYHIYIADNILRFGVGGNGTNSWTNEQSANISSYLDGNYHIFKVESNNNTFKAFIDNNLILSVIDNSYSIPSKIAIRGNGAYSVRPSYVKSFKISDLNGDEIYHKDWKSKIDNVIDKPAVHLPLETNAINTGFTPLTINSVGSPTYTTIDGKKCIKFESGKYLTINSNNIFNLGTSSDFYIEVMLYPNNSSISQWFLSDGEWVYGSTYIGITTDNKIYFTVYNTTSLVLTSSNEIIRNSWNTVKLFRKNNIVFIEVNSILTEYKNINAIINFTYKNTYIGQYSTNGSDNFNGYMSNFKMFVGTSEILETYNDKKVLDLDFKPTNKSYLFKDNNNKCVIHPVNITQRDYQDSQYCCTFNGTNQYLQLGKNDLLNFGADDFIINLKFNKLNTITSAAEPLICAGENSPSNGRAGILLDSTNNTVYIHTQSNGVYYYISTTNSISDDVNNLIVVKKDGVISLILNNVTTSSNFNYDLNFNLNNDTYIGYYKILSKYFSGTIYSIKVLRNTSDITLLNPTVLAFNKTYTLTNGVDSLSMDFDTTDQTVRFINDENTVSAIINDLPLTVDKVDTIGNTDNLILFNDYIGTSSDIKMYDTVLTDNDTFVYDGPYDPEFGEVEIIKPEIQEFMLFDTGNYTVDMYVEGYRDHELFLYNDELQVVVDTAIDRLIHPYIEQNYLYEYSLNDSVTGKKYKIINMGAPGDYTVLIDSRVCLDSDFCVRVYRHDTGNFIGQYELNKSVTPYSVTIPNLDTTKTYDIMLFDKNTMVESRMMSDRSPTPY